MSPHRFHLIIHRSNKYFWRLKNLLWQFAIDSYLFSTFYVVYSCEQTTTTHGQRTHLKRRSNRWFWWRRRRKAGKESARYGFNKRGKTDEDSPTTRAEGDKFEFFTAGCHSGPFYWLRPSVTCKDRPTPAKLPPDSKQLLTNLYKLNRMETSRRPCDKSSGYS